MKIIIKNFASGIKSDADFVKKCHEYAKDKLSKDYDKDTTEDTAQGILKDHKKENYDAKFAIFCRGILGAYYANGGKPKGKKDDKSDEPEIKLINVPECFGSRYKKGVLSFDDCMKLVKELTKLHRCWAQIYDYKDEGVFKLWVQPIKATSKDKAIFESTERSILQNLKKFV